MAFEKELGVTQDRERGCDARSRQHRGAWLRWRRRSITFEIAIGTITAIGGSALLAGAEQGSFLSIALGGLTIMGALLTAASNAISPGKTAEQHRLAALRFSTLGVAYGTLARTWSGDEAARDEFRRLEIQHDEASREGPEPEEWNKYNPERPSLLKRLLRRPS